MLFIPNTTCLNKKNTCCSAADIEARIKILKNNSYESLLIFTSSIPVPSAVKPNEDDTRVAIG
jgi:hypothetical protein